MATCGNFSLCLADRFSRLVLEALGRGELAGLKSRLLELTLNLHEVSDENMCGSLESIVETYYDPLVEGLRSMGYCVVEVEASLQDRLLIGASSGLLSTLLEVGLAWNHILDLPFIPGSAIKGVMRSNMMYRCAELEDVSDRRSCASAVLGLLGSSEKPFSKDESEWVERTFEAGIEPRAEESWAGRVFAADSFPVEQGSGKTGCRVLDFDVITPHYYEGGRVVDSEFDARPRPVPHLVVAPRTKFRFVVAVDRVNEDSTRLLSKYFDGARNPCQLIVKQLLAALSKGAGARTGKGYGIFEPTTARILRSLPATASRRRSSGIKWWEPPHPQGTRRSVG